jgi:hypothetical protein
VTRQDTHFPIVRRSDDRASLTLEKCPLRRNHCNV